MGISIVQNRAADRRNGRVAQGRNATEENIALGHQANMTLRTNHPGPVLHRQRPAGSFDIDRAGQTGRHGGGGLQVNGPTRQHRHMAAVGGDIAPGDDVAKGAACLDQDILRIAVGPNPLPF